MKFICIAYCKFIKDYSKRSAKALPIANACVAQNNRQPSLTYDNQNQIPNPKESSVGKHFKRVNLGSEITVLNHTPLGPSSQTISQFAPSPSVHGPINAMQDPVTETNSMFNCTLFSA